MNPDPEPVRGLASFPRISFHDLARRLGKRYSHVAAIKLLHPFFSWGLSPAGTFLGEDSRLQHRVGLDRDLRNGTLPLGRRVEQAWSKDRLPRFRIRACSGFVGETKQSL